MALPLLPCSANPFWVLVVIGTGAASVAVALTGFCIVGNVLYRLGFTPMLGAGKGQRGTSVRMSRTA